MSTAPTCHALWCRIVKVTPFERQFEPVGTWLSLVEHSLGVRGVGSSNLPVPTILSSTTYQQLAPGPDHRRVFNRSQGEVKQTSLCRYLCRPPLYAAILGCSLRRSSVGTEARQRVQCVALGFQPHVRVEERFRNWPVEQHRSSRGIRFTCSAVCGKPAESALLGRPLLLPAGHRSDRLRGS